MILSWVISAAFQRIITAYAEMFVDIDKYITNLETFVWKGTAYISIFKESAATLPGEEKKQMGLKFQPKRHIMIKYLPGRQPWLPRTLTHVAVTNIDIERD
jgi:hypothetical protein